MGPLSAGAVVLWENAVFVSARAIGAFSRRWLYDCFLAGDSYYDMNGEYEAWMNPLCLSQ